MISWTRDGSEPGHAPVRSQRSQVHHSDSLIAQETGKGEAINIFLMVDIFLCKLFIIDSTKTQTSFAKPLASPPRAASRRRNQFRRMDRGNCSSPPSLTWSSTGDVLGSWPQLSFSLCWERGEGEGPLPSTGQLSRQPLSRFKIGFTRYKCSVYNFSWIHKNILL